MGLSAPKSQTWMIHICMLGYTLPQIFKELRDFRSIDSRIESVNNTYDNTLLLPPAFIEILNAKKSNNSSSQLSEALFLATGMQILIGKSYMVHKQRISSKYKKESDDASKGLKKTEKIKMHTMHDALDLVLKSPVIKGDFFNDLRANIDAVMENIKKLLNYNLTNKVEVNGIILRIMDDINEIVEKGNNLIQDKYKNTVMHIGHNTVQSYEKIIDDLDLFNKEVKYKKELYKIYDSLASIKQKLLIGIKSILTDDPEKSYEKIEKFYSALLKTYLKFEKEAKEKLEQLHTKIVSDAVDIVVQTEAHLISNELSKSKGDIFPELRLEQYSSKMVHIKHKAKGDISRLDLDKIFQEKLLYLKNFITFSKERIDFVKKMEKQIKDIDFERINSLPKNKLLSVNKINKEISTLENKIRKINDKIEDCNYTIANCNLEVKTWKMFFTKIRKFILKYRISRTRSELKLLRETKVKQLDEILGIDSNIPKAKKIFCI